MDKRKGCALLINAGVGSSVSERKKILAAAPLRVMASRYNPCEHLGFYYQNQDDIYLSTFPPFFFLKQVYMVSNYFSLVFSYSIFYPESSVSFILLYFFILLFKFLDWFMVFMPHSTIADKNYHIIFYRYHTITTTSIQQK